MIEFTVKCKNCGSEKNVTDEFLTALSDHLKISKEDINRNVLRRNLKRFKCSSCGEKNARLITHRPKDIPVEIVSTDHSEIPYIHKDKKENHKIITDNFDSDLIYD